MLSLSVHFNILTFSSSHLLIRLLYELITSNFTFYFFFSYIFKKYYISIFYYIWKYFSLSLHGNSSYNIPSWLYLFSPLVYPRVYISSNNQCPNTTDIHDIHLFTYTPIYTVLASLICPPRTHVAFPNKDGAEMIQTLARVHYDTRPATNYPTLKTAAADDLRLAAIRRYADTSLWLRSTDDTDSSYLPVEITHQLNNGKIQRWVCDFGVTELMTPDLTSSNRPPT